QMSGETSQLRVSVVIYAQPSNHRPSPEGSMQAVEGEPMGSEQAGAGGRAGAGAQAGLGTEVGASAGAGAADAIALKVALASEHRLEGVPKIELARRHGLSRFQVARLLDEARAEGIVRIEVVDPTAAGRDLSPLAERLGISSVTVAVARPGEA